MTKEQILQEIGPYNIYDYYIGPIDTNKAMLSPFRKERRPSFVVKSLPDGGMYHKDYGDDQYKGDCFSLVMQLFCLTFREALNKIEKDFKGGGDGIKRVDKVTVVKPPPPSPPKTITPQVRKFRPQDLEYWQQYGITEQDLIKEEIYSIDYYIMGDKTFWVGNELCFGYKFDEGWKIYYPERTEWKWWSSVPNDVIEGWGNVVDFDFLIITKSRKDRMVLSKITKNVINAQNESRSLLTETHKNLFRYFKKVYIFFDADEPGVRACKKITDEMGWNYINTPKILLHKGIKDPAEWVKVEGYSPLQEFLKIKKVI